MTALLCLCLFVKALLRLPQVKLDHRLTKISPDVGARRKLPELSLAHIRQHLKRSRGLLKRRTRALYPLIRPSRVRLSRPSPGQRRRVIVQHRALFVLRVPRRDRPRRRLHPSTDVEPLKLHPRVSRALGYRYPRLQRSQRAIILRERLDVFAPFVRARRRRVAQPLRLREISRRAVGVVGRERFARVRVQRARDVRRDALRVVRISVSRRASRSRVRSRVVARRRRARVRAPASTARRSTSSTSRRGVRRIAVVAMGTGAPCNEFRTNGAMYKQ